MSGAGSHPSNWDDGEISLLAVVNALLRRRWFILGLAVFGAAAGLSLGLLSTRLYPSTAIFLPQEGPRPTAGLAEAASQLGIVVPDAGSGSEWSSALYVELIGSPAILDPLARDTIVVAERQDSAVAVADLLGVDPAMAPEKRVQHTIEQLRSVLQGEEDRRLGTVTVRAATEWPSVSLNLVERVLSLVNQFHVDTRRAQAAAEREFVQSQLEAAERNLSAAEDRLLGFLSRNQSVASPRLVVERQRLEREVGHHQQLYTSWLQNREQARIRQIRDTPAITVIQEPRYPYIGEPRGSVRKGIWGGLAGAVLGVLIALAMDAARRVRGRTSGDLDEFRHLLHQATPRVFRRRRVTAGSQRDRAGQ